MLDALDVFVGEWAMTSSLAPPGHQPRARTIFEWLGGRSFVVQRWEIDVPEAPDGIAIIGGDPLLQHYFDSRGVARVYEMTFADGVWTLERHADAPDFSQRFAGRFEDRDTIAGRWERSDDGERWQLDFELAYSRVR
jgi:hypothetical protein